ncbi:hypothetical protein KR067_012419, partial [Drosophila pandora]
NAVVFKFSNFICESHNKSWFVFNQCRLKAVSRDRIVLNMVGTVLHPVSNVQVHAKVFKRANGYKPWLFDTQIDACRFLKKSYNPFAKLVYGLFQEFTNINHTCPFVGPQIVKDFYLKPELLLLPLPTGDYMLTLRWLFFNRIQFDTNVSFVFVEDIASE